MRRKAPKRERDERGRLLPGHSVQPSDEQRPSGLARVDALTALTPEQVLKALSGYVIGQLGFKPPQIACLKLLGEHYGLWGTGRKAPPDSDKPKAEGFKMGE